VSPNNLLSIVIPTFNRADFLDRCLGLHIPIARLHNIQIFVSDNASTDLTQRVIEKYKKEYPFLQYFRNESNLGYDENVERALKYPDTEYVWLLGDAYKFSEDDLAGVLSLIIKRKYHAIVVNLGDRVKDVKEKEYSDYNLLLAEIGWHTTCLSTLVFSKEVILSANHEVYYDSYFMQTGILLEFLPKNPFLLYWAQGISVSNIRIQGIEKQGWHYKTFDVWGRQWPELIFSLPKSYELKIKLKCILDHGSKSGLFSLKSLLYMRRRGILDFKTYQRYKYSMPLVIKYNKTLIMMISFVPKGILGVAEYILRKFI